MQTRLTEMLGIEHPVMLAGIVREIVADAETIVGRLAAFVPSGR